MASITQNFADQQSAAMIAAATQYSTQLKNAASSAELVARLNKAIDMQIDASLKLANFDTSVEGQIIAVQDKENGVYLVQIQSAKFEAYAESGQYYEGETVYVRVPRNDYSQQKFITGRKVAGPDEINNTPFKFKYPFDDFIALANLTSDSGTSLNKLTTERSWRANKPEDGAEPNYTLSNVEQDPNILWHWRRGNKDFLGTTLGVQIKVRTYLGQYNPISGNYGIRFLVRGDEMQANGQVQQNVVREFYFNCDNMYGNPYGFLDETVQQVLINISQFNKIDEIAAYFWQDHNFVDDAGNTISYWDEYNPGIYCEPNIFISDLSVGYGLQTSDIGNEKAMLFTYDSTTYGENAMSTTPRVQLDTRTLHFGWVHKCPDENYMMINSVATLNRFNDEYIEEDKKKAHIYWYHQVRNADEVEGIPYVTPGTDLNSLLAKKEELANRRDSFLTAAENMREAYSSEEQYNTYTNNIRKKYNTQIAAIDDMIDNMGYQSMQRISTYGGPDYRYMPEFTDKFEATIQMDINQFRERFKVVVAWENTYEASEPLEFQNVDKSVLENMEGKKNELIFRLLRTQKYRENNQTKTRLIEDNSIGNFFVYDENNKCIQNEEETFWSDMWFYIQVWMWSEEAEQYVPLTTTSTDDTITVSWQFPIADTMICSVSQIDQDDLSNYKNSLIPIVNNFDGVQASTRKFRIDDHWDMRAHNNIIRATVNRNGKQYNLSKLLTFGQSGCMGSKYTLRIDLLEPADSFTMVGDQGFTISTSVYSQNGEKLESSAFDFNYELLNSGSCTLGYSSAYPGQVTISGSGYHQSGYKAILRKNAQNYYVPPLFKVTVDLKDPEYRYDISNVRGFMSVDKSAGVTKYDIGCPDRVEYKSDGSIPVYDNSYFTVRDLSTNELVYPNWYLSQYNSNGTVRSNNIQYLNLESHSFTVDQLNTNATTNPANNTVATYYQYKINPYLVNNSYRDRTTMFWDDDMESAYPTYLRCEVGGYVFWQSIVFARNVYASSIINSWDGQLLIDKEKNAILTRMLSAGVKDTKNRFSGVIMGDWSDYGDTSIDPIGLYGFKEGVQTFGFKNDGTGFIGKAGYGQITFDGENALISDRTKNHYINLNPTVFEIDANNRLVHVKGREGYSQYFIYSKSTKLNIVNNDDTEVGSGGTTAQDNGADESKRYLAGSSRNAEYGFLNIKWAKKFMNDTENDYFVVDPTNGVYISGGFIAKYGYIGDCLELSSAGLTYQKNNGIIFIGQERTRDGKLVITPSHPTNGYDDVYWSSQKGDKYNFRSGAKPSSSWGRYIIWVGDTNSSGRPKYLYPNFGLEHNGIVHLNKAYVQGEIHASSLQIGMDDGEYHDARSRFARTYYSDYNPANLTNQNGICDKVYGDILLTGDLWYDTNVTVNIKDISSFSITPKKDANGNEVQLDTSNPAQEDTNSNYPYGFDVSQLSEKESRGYVCYEWIGHQDDVKNYPECTWTYQKLNETTGKMETVTETIPNHKGWRRLPVLSKDTLTEISMLALQSTKAIQTLQTKLTSALKTAYTNIRTGMSPISFFEDGNCYVSIAHKQKTVTKIGTVPSGISIYQVDNNGYPNGAYFLLNGQRMGFYKKYTVNGTTVDAPMLTYYQGNMGLAGSLVFGIDMKKVTTQDSDKNDVSLYKNYLDGPNAKISLGDGSIVLDSDVKNYGSSAWNPKITLGSLSGKATIKLAGYEIVGNTQSNLTASFGLSMTGSVDTDGTNNGQGTPFDKWSPQDGDSVGSNLGDNIKITYKKYSVGSRTNYKINTLNYFKIVNSGRGVKILENLTNFTQGPQDTTTKYDFTLVTPEKTLGSHQNYITGWDLIDSSTGSFTNLEATSIYCKNLYVYSGNTAYEMADKKWVTDKLYEVYTKLSSLISSAQKTGNSAYGAAKHHSHNTSGRVAGTDWAG